jgi:hypothetical protein
MDIFVLKPDVESYHWLTCSDPESFQVLHDLVGASVADTWQPLQVEFIKDENADGAEFGDFPSLGSVPCFSGSAVLRLKDVLERNGELLPLHCSDGEFFLWNVTNRVDTLDVEASEVVRFSDGGIMRLERYEFRQHLIMHEEAFRIPQLRSIIFVTDQFRRRVEESGLRGFNFRSVWSSGETAGASSGS